MEDDEIDRKLKELCSHEQGQKNLANYLGHTIDYDREDLKDYIVHHGIELELLDEMINGKPKDLNYKSCQESSTKKLHKSYLTHDRNHIS